MEDTPPILIDPGLTPERHDWLGQEVRGPAQPFAYPALQGLQPEHIHRARGIEVRGQVDVARGRLLTPRHRPEQGEADKPGGAAFGLVRAQGRIVPGVADVEPQSLASQETVEFRQLVKGQAHPWRVFASAMSDGTLRAFGVLLAVFQAASTQSGARPPLLIGLEEPEMALHPAAASVLLSALREGSKHCQIIVTSHSP